MRKIKVITPQADMLMGSMRSMGYSFEAAIADIIDNSISANAKNIRVLFPTSSLDIQAVGILDDGIGMSNETLVEAMRYGSSSYEAIRDEKDLGRFGLGMKAASLSQCRVLTVVSIWEGEISSYQWDYNYIQETKKWNAIEPSEEEQMAFPYIDLLLQQNKGTLVIWSDFDVLSKSYDGYVYAALDQLKNPVADHLSLIFHRFLNRPFNKISIYVNKQEIMPLDPFLESHKKTTTMKEKTIAIYDSYGKEQLITVSPFILPYLSDMTEKDKKLMGGVENMRSRQGFYVYRNERLIIWGNWFGMSRRNELTKNARIRVDIPNALDDIWSIDIRKQVAKIPKRIQNQLTKIVEDALGISVKKHTYRGRRQNVNDDIDYIWNRIQTRDKNYFYKINRESALYRYVVGRMSDEDIEYVNLLVSEIENNIPINDIYMDKSNESIIVEENEHREEDVFQTAVTIISLSRAVNPLPTNELIDNLLKSEPFCRFKNMHELLKKHFSNGTE